MRKIFVCLAVVLISLVAASAQTKDEAAFMTLEKQAWDAFGKGDGKFFETFMADEGMVVTDFGFSSKAQTVKDISTKPCEVKSYDFSNFKVRMIDKNTALVTYEATQDTSCGGQKAPGKVAASSIYVKRKGKWMATYHQESAVQMMPSK